MGRQQREAVRPTSKEPPDRLSSLNSVASAMFVAGIVCLAIGLGVGYYFGRQAGQSAASAPEPQGTNTSLANPAEFAQAEAMLKSTLQSNPKDLNALIQLGNLYYDHGRYRDAVEWYGKALEIDGKNADVRTDRGTSYWNLGEADAAIREFQKALEISPSHAQTLYNLGVVYLNGKNNPAEAKKAWEQLLATNPNYPDKAKLQQQIASLSGPPAGSPSAGGSGMEDLLNRMKSK